LNESGQADFFLSAEQRDAADGTHVLTECVAVALGALLWRRHRCGVCKWGWQTVEIVFRGWVFGELSFNQELQ